jgi:hypothetical protein
VLALEIVVEFEGGGGGIRRRRRNEEEEEEEEEGSQMPALGVDGGVEKV